MSQEPKDRFTASISKHVWNAKYRWRKDLQPVENSIEETWQRLARAASSVEGLHRQEWEKKFYEALEDFKFLPGGRIWAGAGTEHHVTLFNCFVMGRIEDSMDGIFESLKEGALTMHQGGGVGYDFSTLRPNGSVAKSTGTIASGPVSFMRIWNAMCATILSTGARRGAMMATLRCDHPDIEEFVTAKHKAGELNHFNMSVLVTDEFMKAVEEDEPWELKFDGIVHHQLPARGLWKKIMENTYDHAEPGVIFIDRVNEENNLWYAEKLSATNPCGEIPLPPYGACNLGSINLTQFVLDAFSPQARWNIDEIKKIVPVAVRFLDNIIDISQFPLPRQEETEKSNRRIGLGVTGLGDALIMLNHHYGNESARQAAAQVMELICLEAYQTSIEIAKEKGVFPLLDKEKYLKSHFIRKLPQDIQVGIHKWGIRNSHLLAIAPTGTISLLANNISSGIEPAFDFKYRRNVLNTEGRYNEHEVLDFAAKKWIDEFGRNTPFSSAFVTALELDPQEHLKMQAALQPFIDNSISKTINIPHDFPFDQFVDVYRQAYQLGTKGCTTFRPNEVTGSILIKNNNEAPVEQSHCCTPEREAD